MIATFPFLGEYVPTKRRTQAILTATSLSTMALLYTSCKLMSVFNIFKEFSKVKGKTYLLLISEFGNLIKYVKIM